MASEKSLDEGLDDIGTNTNVEVVKYSVFTSAEKWCIVAMVSYAAWFSTLSSFIYYPAIPTLSTALGVSVSKINLTVTTYMSVATIAPTLVGDAADILGRRPIYVLTLSIYFVANLAIALSHSYSALLGLRVLQALAISGNDLLELSRFGS
jgi:MFS family permease